VAQDVARGAQDTFGYPPKEKETLVAAWFEQEKRSWPGYARRCRRPSLLDGGCNVQEPSRSPFRCRAMSHSNVAEKLARLGYAARGAVYLIIGGLALLAAAGSGGRTTDSKGAFQALLEAPFGGVLLAVIVIGFLCFAAWRLAQAFFDADRLGRQRKALMRRAAYGASAAVYVGLAFMAGSILLGHHHEGGDQSARDWTAALLSVPFGRWLVAAVGIAFCDRWNRSRR
jgi:Domain of Unknown Function (DUF1206)